MKTIYWTDHVATSDSNAKILAEKLLNQDEIWTGNELVLGYARLLRVQNKIDDLQIIWRTETIPVNEYGAIVDWPKGFCAEHGQVAADILKLAIAKRKSKRNST